MSVPLFDIEAVVALAIQRLTADSFMDEETDGRIYRAGLEPDDDGSAGYPRVLVSPAFSVDKTTANGTFIHSNNGVLVKVIGEGTSYDVITPIANRAIALLNGYSGTVDGVYVAKFSMWDSPPQEPDREGGVVYPVLNKRFRAPAYAV